MMAAKDMPMPLDFAAFLADTTHLSTVEIGAYVLILGAMWRSPDGHIESNDLYLARAARLSLDKWKRIAPTMRALLSVRAEDGRVSQKRLLRVRAEVQIAAELADKNPSGRNPGNGSKLLKRKKGTSESGETDSTLFFSSDSKSDSEAKEERKEGAKPLPKGWVPDEAEVLYGKTVCKLTADEIEYQAERMRRWAYNNAHLSKGRKPRWDLCFRNFLDDAGAKKRARNGLQQAGVLPVRQQGSASRGRVSFGDLARDAIEEAQAMSGQGPVEVHDVSKH